MKTSLKSLLILGAFFLASAVSAMQAQERTLEDKIKTLRNCASACEACVENCSQDEQKMPSSCSSLCGDCAKICTLNADLMAGGSQFSEKFSALCDEVCKACGDECSKNDDADCQRCAQACYACVND